MGASPKGVESPKRQRRDRELRQDTPRPTRNQEKATLGEIQTILGGFAGGGTTISSRKAHAGEVP